MKKKNINNYIIVMIAMIVIVTIGLSGCPETKGIIYWKIGLEGAGTLNDIAYGSGVTTTVGNTGAIFTSTNNSSWISRDTNDQDTATLVDDVKWTIENLSGVAHGAGQFVAVGDNGTILISTDGGVTWASDLNDQDTEDPADDTTWTSEDLISITYGDGKFVTVGANGVILTSLTNFVEIPTESTTDATTDVMIVEQRVWVTQLDDQGTPDDTVDDANWTGENLISVAYGKGVFVTLGDSGSVLTAILTSSDGGATWNVAARLSVELNSITYAGSRFLAVGGNSTILTSTNGVHWTARVIQGSQTGVLQDVAYASGTWIVVGDTVFRSTNGVKWVEGDDQISTNSIINANGTLVTVGNNSIYTGILF